MLGATHRLPGERLVHPGELEHHATRLDHRDPAFGLPLPDPIRVSAGFFVTGLSGKIVIHTLPPRRMCRVIATRAASIWRFVIQPGSIATIA